VRFILGVYGRGQAFDDLRAGTPSIGSMPQRHGAAGALLVSGAT